MAPLPSSARPSELEIGILRIDPENPRFPEGFQARNENELIPFIATTYNALEIARSIVRFGYFASEPLIVVEQEDGTCLVVEGNRRLAALKILADPTLANGLDDAEEWRALAGVAQLPERIPVVVAASKQDVAPIIGYRHISGIEPWEPYEKSRFVSNLIDREGLSFNEVASIVGERATDIATYYRNYAIVKQTQAQMGIDTRRVVNRFGVFTRAMSSLPLRNFIGVPPPSSVYPGIQPVPSTKRDAVLELFSWLFGDDENGKVITESRDITDLGTVVGSEDGLEALRQTRDLQAAFIAAGGIRERLLNRLVNALNNLVAAELDLPAYLNDEEVQSLLTQCQETLNRLVDIDAES